MTHVEPHVAADFARHEVVVAGENLDTHAMVCEGADCRSGALLGRIEKADEAGEDEIRFVGNRIRSVIRIEVPVRHTHHAEPVLIHFGHELADVVGALRLELDDIWSAIAGQFRHSRILVPHPAAH